MNRAETLAVVRPLLALKFGSAVVARSAERVRHAAGLGWRITVVVPASEGDLPVGTLDVDEEGRVTPALGVDDLVRAVRAPRITERAAPEPLADEPSMDDGFDDLSFISGIGEVTDGDAPPDDPTEIRHRVEEMLEVGDRASLLGARTLLPRLLADEERRGVTLVWMAEIERRLHDDKQALEFLEAAAREFADRFDLVALERCATMARAVATPEELERSTIAKSLAACTAHMQPLESPWDAPGLVSVRPEEREALEGHTATHTLEDGQILLLEGSPSRGVFIVQSGLVAVLLDAGEGRVRRARFCPPGWLLGESSVLGENATATATLQAHGPTTVFAIAADALKATMAKNAVLRRHIATTKYMHRFDSFLTTHAWLGQLDVAVRDDFIGCVQRIAAFEVDTVLGTQGAVSDAAWLVVAGEIALVDSPTWTPRSRPAGTVGGDGFVGMRDALHQAPLPLTVVARAGATVACFDAEMLRALIAEAPAAVTAILERLG